MATISNDFADGLVVLIIAPFWLLTGLGLILFAALGVTYISDRAVSHVAWKYRINRLPRESVLIERFEVRRAELGEL